MKFSFRFVSFFCFSRFDERIKELKLVPVCFPGSDSTDYDRQI